MKKIAFASCLILFTISTTIAQDTNSLAATNPIYNKERRKGQSEERRFIRFSIENTSAKTINCYVKGKKPTGGKFSYGFPMKPGQIREKDWSIGSKVYIVNKLGIPKLLTVIEPEDEHEVVDLFRSKS